MNAATVRIGMIICGLLAFSPAVLPQKPAAPAPPKAATIPATVTKPASTTLSTDDVIAMVKAGLGEEVIILAIRQEDKPFDLSALQLVQLKQAGLSDNVLKVMLDPKAEIDTAAQPPAGAQPPQPAQTSQQRVQDKLVPQEDSSTQTVVLQDRTLVHLVVTKAMSSATAKQNDPVELKVDEDVFVNGVLVIPRGTTAVGQVLIARKRGRWGKDGSLQFAVTHAQATDGSNIRLEAVVGDAEIKKSSAAFMMGLVGGLKKGKDLEVPEGFIVKAFVDGDEEIKIIPSPPLKGEVEELAPTSKGGSK